VFLGSLRANKHEAWIAMEMEMIEAPHEVGRYFVRAPARVQAPRRRSFEQMSFLSWALWVCTVLGRKMRWDERWVSL
jgi:hypothetical protein